MGEQVAGAATADACKDMIQQLGGGFMFSREVKQFNENTGVPGFMGAYTRGRGGVLGEVDADVVAAAFAFFPPHAIRAAWESVAHIPAAEAAAGYAAAAQGFGRRKLAGLDGADRLAELLSKVVTAASPAGVPLFAGWRAMPLPDDAQARIAQLAHVLRELRGGLHAMAVLSRDLSPLTAVLISGSPINSGPDQAKFYGWPEPHTEPTEDERARWQEAEQATTRMIAPAFAVLDDTESAELIDLLAAAHKTAFSAR